MEERHERGDIEAPQDQDARKIVEDDDAPHDKTFLTTPFGRLVDRVTYADIGAAIGTVLASSSLYFWLMTPCGFGLGNDGKLDWDGLGDAIYFSIVTFTSLGYGELTPVGFGRVVAALTVLSGLALVALFVGKVASERQYSLLLLLHTSDCQRRLSAFSADLRAATGWVNRSCARGQTGQLRDSTRELGQRLAALSRYVIFNSHQARMAAFGNASALGGLFEELYDAQLACVAAFQAPDADELVCSRALQLVERIERLARRVATMQERAKQEHSGVITLAVRKLRLRLDRSFRSSGSTGVAEQTPQLPGLARFKEQQVLLGLWAKQHESAWLLAAVLKALPHGAPQSWGRHQNKAVAAGLGIGKNLAQLCIDTLIRTRRIPRKVVETQAQRASRLFRQGLEQRANGLNASCLALEQAMLRNDPDAMARELGVLRGHLDKLAAARNRNADGRRDTSAGPGAHGFLVAQLERTYGSCRAVETYLGAGEAVARQAAAGAAQVQDLASVLGCAAPAAPPVNVPVRPTLPIVQDEPAVS